MDWLRTSRRTVILPSIVVFFFLALSSPLFGASPSGRASIGSSSWNDPLNWNPNVLPAAGDDVTIPNTGAFFPTLDVDPPALNSLTIDLGASLTTSAAHYTIITDTLTLNGTIVGGAAPVTLTTRTAGRAIFVGGGLGGPGALELPAAAVNAITTSATLTIGDVTHTGTITVDGAMNFTGPTGPVVFGSAGVGGAVAINFNVTTATNVTVNGAGVTVAGGVTMNGGGGTILVDGGGGAIALGSSTLSTTFGPGCGDDTGRDDGDAGQHQRGERDGGAGDSGAAAERVDQPDGWHDADGGERDGGGRRGDHAGQRDECDICDGCDPAWGCAAGGLHGGDDGERDDHHGHDNQTVTLSSGGLLTVNGNISTSGANNVSLTGVGVTVAGGVAINGGAGTIWLTEGEGR